MFRFPAHSIVSTNSRTISAYRTLTVLSHTVGDEAEGYGRTLSGGTTPTASYDL
jgi:hypothetical protein